MKRYPCKLGQRGWTLIELMMTIGIMGLIVPALTLLFTICYQGLSTVEMHVQLKALNEQLALHFHEQINSSKHMFQNDSTTSGGLNFIGQLQMTNAPATLSFNKMATAQNGTTVTFSPAAGAVSNEFGDCLFYAAADRPLTINGISYVAPLTISGTSIKNSSGATVTVNLDVYRFYLDYLSSAGDMKPIRGITSYWLIEWQSVQFVDAFELQDIGTADSTLQSNVIKWLANGTNFPSGKPVTYAWDPSQIALTSGTNYAFYDLTTGGAMTGQTTFTIPMQAYTPLSRTSTGVITNFNYGVPGNYAKLGSSPPVPAIPRYCPSGPATNAFPGGFEVGIQGSNGDMQVLTRCVLLAQGNSGRMGFIWDDTTSISNARDVW